MNKTKVTKKDILFLTISVFIVVAAWVGFNLYHAFVASTLTETLQMQIVPISPQFDVQTIQQLKNRKQVDPLYDPVRSPIITPQPNETQSATGAARPVPTQGSTIERSGV